MLEIKALNTSTNEVPEHATHGSAGMDLRAKLDVSVVLEPMKRMLVPTGIHLELPIGYEAQIRPRSGLALKHGITVLNTPATIDSDYRGDVGVILMNLSNEPFQISNGDRIAQMVIAKYEPSFLTVVETLSDTQRGEGGFGSTGR